MRILGRKKAHRDHLVRNLATSLVLFETVDTTAAKAKELKSFLDKIIARSKKADLNTIRRLQGIFFDKNAVKKVISELVPRYEGRNSGFIKSYHLKNRVGDNASMMRLELVDKKVFVKKEETEKKAAKKEEVIENKEAKTNVKVRNAK
jgi:large subunit ribosomal protein L17